MRNTTARQFMLLSWIIFIFPAAFGQNKVNFKKLGNSQTKQAAVASSVFSSPSMGSIRIDTLNNVDWDVSAFSLGIKHAADQNQKRIERIKRRKSLLKAQSSTAIPGANDKESLQKMATVPQVSLSFKGNLNNGFTPPDNNIAVSDNGNVVSVVNSNFFLSDQNGGNTTQNSFSNFFSVLGLSGNFFDPKVIYDPSTDKFIMVVLSGNTASNSTVVVAFSQTNNPYGQWWFYTLPGNPLNDGSWFDYPNIGVSTTELYISGNLFDANDNFNQTVIYQIDKANGFSGGNITWLRWNDVKDANNFSDFTVVPISFGFDGTLTPGIFFISSDPGGGNQVMLYWTTNTAQNNPTLQVNAISVSQYNLAGNALQLGSTDVMNTNDCRIQSGFFADGTVHFVMNSERSNAFTGIYYGRVDVASLTATNSTFGLQNFDYAFPTVAPFGTTTTSKEVVMGFLRSGASIYPEFRVVTCDDNFNWSSSVQVKSGIGFVNFLNNNVERWGDYSGIARRHISSGVEVWISGCYGDNFDNGFSNVLSNWIGKITRGSSPQIPIADFTSNQTSITEGQQISFQDLSQNTPTTWSWSFPGGSPNASSAQNPQVTYNVAGTYSVTLTVTNPAGNDVEIKTNYITVSPNVQTPIADFSANQTNIIEGTQISFTDLSNNNPSSWSWSFPGGSPNASSAQNPQVTYNVAGTYSVTLTASNTAGNDVETKTNYITVSPNVQTPVANFTANQTTITEGDQVSFTDLSTNNPSTWSWSFPGGNPNSSSVQNPQVTYNVAGTYAVTLTAANTAGNDVETKNAYITVNQGVITPVTDFSANQTMITEGDQVSFTDLSINNPTTWSWSFPGGSPSISTSQNPQISYNVAGTYSVSLIASNTAGNDAETKNAYITVNPAVVTPVADFSANQTTVTEGDQINFTDLSTNIPSSWSWSFPGGTPSVSTSQNPSITYNSAGTYDVSLIASNSAGNDSEIKVAYIVVNPDVQVPVADFTANQTSITEGEQIDFSDLSTNSPDTWSWSFPGGSPSISTAQNPSIIYNTAGTYDVSLIAGNIAGNDSETKTTYIVVNPDVQVPAADFTANQTNISEGDQVNFTDLSSNNPSSWTWSFPGASPATSALQNPQVTYPTAGTYAVSLIATNSAGNDSETKSAYINVSAPIQVPTANFTVDDSTLTAGGVANFQDLSTNNPSSWVWSFPGGNPNSSNLQNPIIVYSDTGIYSVSLVVSNAAGNDSRTKENYIIVNDPAVSINDLESPIRKFEIYPNPTTSDQRIYIKFELEESMVLDFYLLDNKGRVLKYLIRHRNKIGENLISFNGGMLSAGQYYVLVQNLDKQILQYGKIIIR
ncbi:MAG: PKD domain-containing protein [Bacteroidota bacterium]